MLKPLFGRRRGTVPETIKRNLESVAQLEQEFLRQRSPAACLSDRITDFAGRPFFITAQVVCFFGWVLLNTVDVFGVVPFDPYPFSLLGLCVASEAALLSFFVLMSQKRQRRQADQWAHVHLQVSLLAEQEMTKMLQLLRSICNHLGLETVVGDKELKEMVKETHVLALVQEVGKMREGESLATEANSTRAA
jgi:uncharacterized membrane protein